MLRIEIQIPGAQPRLAIDRQPVTPVQISMPATMPTVAVHIWVLETMQAWVTDEGIVWEGTT